MLFFFCTIITDGSQKPIEARPQPLEAVVAVNQEPGGELTVKDEPETGDQPGTEKQVSALFSFCMSCIMKNLAIYTCENKDADQQLCFHFKDYDSTIPLLFKSEISDF